MLLKLDGQNLSRNVLEQSHFFWEWNTRMLELIEQNDTEDEHGSYPGTNLQWFPTHCRYVALCNDFVCVVKYNFKKN